MKPILATLCLSLACCGLLTLSNGEQQKLNADELKQNVTDEMHLITKSLEDLLGELAIIKREANGRLASVRAAGLSASAGGDQADRIRQTKVSKFVLKRIAELETESLGMRDDLAKMFNNKNPEKPALYNMGQARQEDHDFEDAPSSTALTSGSTTTSANVVANSPAVGMPATTTIKPDAEEAAKIGFDLEALKRLGADLESEIEARAQQNPESLRGVHEQVIKLVDNMVRNYVANLRRAVQRVTNFIDNRQPAPQSSSLPRQSATHEYDDDAAKVMSSSKSVLDQLEQLSNKVHEFDTQWNKLTGRQQSPLIDRIPPRGVELWRDFWDTVRKQIRRINQEFVQISRDMTRAITGRLNFIRGPSSQSSPASLLYSNEAVMIQFQEFYAKMSAALRQEQAKLDSMSKIAQAQQSVESINKNEATNLIDESDDEQTRNELTRNVALRQQIQQEINVFSGIFDIMSTFIQRLRESALNIRDVLQPGLTNNNDNNPVTPGPSIKPQVDQLLGETIDSQRNINGQAKPVLLPNSRPALNPKRN